MSYSGNQSSYYSNSLDNIKLLLSITNEQEMFQKISTNIPKIFDIFSSFKSKLYINQVNQNDISQMTEALKFIDNLNLFMEENDVRKFKGKMGEISSILQKRNFEYRDAYKNLDDTIQYTEMTIINHRNNFYLDMYFNNRKALSEEIERELDQVTKGNKFDFKLFKQMQNIYWVVKNAIIDDKKKKELDERFSNMKILCNNIKHKNIKDKKYGNIYSNQGYSYYEDYGNEYKNHSGTYDYNDFYRNDDMGYYNKINNNYDTGIKPYYYGRSGYRKPNYGINNSSRKYHIKKQPEEKEVEIPSDPSYYNQNKEEIQKEENNENIYNENNSNNNFSQNENTNINGGNDLNNAENNDLNNNNFNGGIRENSNQPIDQIIENNGGNGDNSNINNINNINNNDTTNKNNDIEIITGSPNLAQNNSNNYKRKPKNIYQNKMIAVEVPTFSGSQDNNNVQNNNENNIRENENNGANIENNNSNNNIENNNNINNTINYNEHNGDDNTNSNVQYSNTNNNFKYKNFYYNNNGYKPNIYNKNNYHNYYGRYNAQNNLNFNNSNKKYIIKSPNQRRDFVEISENSNSMQSNNDNLNNNNQNENNELVNGQENENVNNNNIPIEENKNEPNGEVLKAEENPSSDNPNDINNIELIKNEQNQNMEINKISETIDNFENNKGEKNERNSQNLINEKEMEKNIKDININETNGEDKNHNNNLDNNIVDNNIILPKNEKQNDINVDLVNNKKEEKSIEETIQNQEHSNINNDNFINPKIMEEENTNNKNNDEPLQNKDDDDDDDEKDINFQAEFNIFTIGAIGREAKGFTLKGNSSDEKEDDEKLQDNNLDENDLEEAFQYDIEKDHLMEMNEDDQMEEVKIKEALQKLDIPKIIKDAEEELEQEELEKYNEIKNNDNNINNNEVKENINNNEVKENININITNNNSQNTSNKYKNDAKNIDKKLVDKIKDKLSNNFKREVILAPKFTYYKNDFFQQNSQMFDNNFYSFIHNYKNNNLPMNMNNNFLFQIFANYRPHQSKDDISKEYLFLKILEVENPKLIWNNMQNFEKRILIPLYQKIIENRIKRHNILENIYDSYHTAIYNSLQNSKEIVIDKVQKYGSFSNTFMVDIGDTDIDICIVPKCSLTFFQNNYLSKLKDGIINSNLGDIKDEIVTTNYILLRILYCNPKGKFNVDITVHNMLPIYNSYLIKLYGLYDQRFHIMGIYLKYWAKTNNIHGAKGNYLSSYALLLMMIHFLQKIVEPKILPNLQKIPINNDWSQPKYGKEIYEYYCGDKKHETNCYFETNPIRIKEYMKKVNDGKFNDETVTNLLVKFFEYYAYFFDYSKQKISVHKELEESIKDKDDNFPFSIEDPFEYTHNPGKSMLKNSDPYKKFIKAMKKEVNFILSGEYVKRLEYVMKS